MIKFEKNRLIISIQDQDPKKLARDLRMSLINILQYQFMDSPDFVDDELIYSNYKLLELLKDLMKKEGEEDAKE